jgi:phosphate transport system substrate-binding protein
LTDLTPQTKSGSNLGIFAGSIALLLVLVFVLFWKLMGGGHTPSTGTTAGNTILRLAGSNTIGAKLAPALAQEFLKDQGARNIKLLPDKEDEQIVQGDLPQQPTPVIIHVAAHGSTTAFQALADGSCDIGMASRKIKDDETAKLSSLGDMTSPANEHVLGLDGIAVIVNASNPVESLVKDQIAGIFAGKIPDWSQVNGRRGAINLYARDDKSGTFDTFKNLVPGSTPLAQTAKRLEDSNALSDDVAGDQNGIGFVGMPYIRSAKALAVAEKGATPLRPNRLTVATEDYPLSRRLYLYTPTSSQNPYVRKFVEFALSKAGQDVVGSVGFVAQNVERERVPVPEDAPSEYKQLTKGAQRLSLDFRFRVGRSDLDNKAIVDLDRVVTFVGDLKYNGGDIMLFGFADSTGSRPMNMQLSDNRAKTVEEQFKQRGLKPGVVKGFGPDMPVASNETDEGREKNRRVEIWIKR